MALDRLPCLHPVELVYRLDTSIVASFVLLRMGVFSKSEIR